MTRSRFLTVFEVLFAVITWGASFVATKVALRSAMPATVVWLRFLMGFIILGLAVAARREFAIPSRKDLLYFALLGFIGITWHQWLQSTGLETAAASTTAWIISTTPVFMAILAVLVLKERLSWLQAGGILLAGVGVLLVVSKGDLTSLASGHFGTKGDILILISAPNWAIFSTLSRRGLKQNPAARMMLYVMGFGWLFSSVPFLFGPGIADITRLTFDGWVGVAFLGIFCSGLAYVAWYDGLQSLPAARVGAFLYLEPFVTVIVAALVLSEPLLWSSFLGGGLILFGVWLVNRQNS